MEIVFLGTGGGRINLIRQVRATGGFRINSGPANIHVDPGPGALLHSNRLKENPLHLDAVLVTHDHVDHSNDAMLLVEAMSGYALKKKGIIIGSSHVLEGDRNNDRAIDKYHQEHAAEIYVARWGDRKKFTTKKGSFEIEIIEARHDEPTTFGFRLFTEGKVIGYTSDTNYFKELGKAYSGCDYLIVNCLKPLPDNIPDHLKTDDVIEILKVAKPKVCVITHFGLKMIRAGPAAEAAKIEKETGIRTLAARDGMRMGKGLESF